MTDGTTRETDASHVARAIAIVENSRRTHVEWAEFIESGKPWTPDPDHVGDVAHHRACIEGYDYVIGVLRGLVPPSVAAVDHGPETPFGCPHQWGDRIGGSNLGDMLTHCCNLGYSHDEDHQCRCGEVDA